MKKLKAVSVMLATIMLAASFGIIAFANDPSAGKLWQWTAEPQFAFAHLFENGFAIVSDGEFAVMPNGDVTELTLLGLMNPHGELIVPIEFHWIVQIDGAIRASKTVYREEGDYEGQLSWLPDGTPLILKTWTVDADGSLTIYIPDPNRFDWIWGEFMPGLFFDNRDAAFRNRLTNEAVVFEYSGISPFSRGFATVLGPYGWGLIDADNNIIIPLEFDTIHSFIDQQLRNADEISPWELISGNSVSRAISRDGKWGLVNDQGEIIVDLIFEHGSYRGWPIGIAEFHNGIAPVHQSGRWGVIDVMGEIIVPIEYAWASTRPGLAVMRNDEGLYGAFDNPGELVLPFEYDLIFGFDSDMIAVSQNGLIGFANMNGELVIENSFHTTLGFWGNFASVARDGFGLINKNGDVVLPMIYAKVWGADAGVAAVRVGEQWGFLRNVSNITDNMIDLIHSEMFDYRFVILQIDNHLANNNAVLTQIDAENENVTPVLENGRTLVPLRFISENFDIDVDWIAEEQKAVIIRGETVIELYIGRYYAYVNGESVSIDIASVIRNEITLIPIRFVSELMGFNVNFQPENRVVTIRQMP